MKDLGIITQEDLDEMIKSHEIFLNNKGTLGEKLHLHDCVLYSLEFNHSNISKANISNCRFENCSFNSCNMKNITMSGCDFKNVTFNGSNLYSSWLWKSKFFDCRISDCDLSHSYMGNVELEVTRLIGNNTYNVNGLDIYSLENIGYDEKVTYIPSIDKVFTDYFVGSSESFYEYCEDEQKECDYDLNYDIARYMIEKLKTNLLFED